MDDADANKRRPLTPRQQFKNLMNEMAEAGWDDDRPLSPEERGEARAFAVKVKDFARTYAAWLEAGQPLWGEKAAPKNERSEEDRGR